MPEHPHVVKVVWADRFADETPYIVFEYLDGLDVEKQLENDALSLEDAKKITEQTAAPTKLPLMKSAIATSMPWVSPSMSASPDAIPSAMPDPLLARPPSIRVSYQDAPIFIQIWCR